MEKESQASLLASLVGTAVNRPGIYAKTFQNQGGDMSNSPNVNQTFHGPVTGVAGNVQGEKASIERNSMWPSLKKKTQKNASTKAATEAATRSQSLRPKRLQ